MSRLASSRLGPSAPEVLALPTYTPLRVTPPEAAVGLGNSRPKPRACVHGNSASAQNGRRRAWRRAASSRRDPSPCGRAAICALRRPNRSRTGRRPARALGRTAGIGARRPQDRRRARKTRFETADPGGRRLRTLLPRSGVAVAPTCPARAGGHPSSRGPDAPLESPANGSSLLQIEIIRASRPWLDRWEFLSAPSRVGSRLAGTPSAIF